MKGQGKTKPPGESKARSKTGARGTAVARSRVEARSKAKTRREIEAASETKSRAQEGKRRRAQPPQAMESSVPAKIIAAVRRIPRGKVCTYGSVAEVAGLPRRARLVGTVLRQQPASTKLPWHRVINAGGRISFPGGSDAHALQRRRLEAEGVVFVGGRVDLRRYGWPAREEQLDELLWKPADQQ